MIEKCSPGRAAEQKEHLATRSLWRQYFRRIAKSIRCRILRADSDSREGTKSRRRRVIVVTLNRIGNHCLLPPAGLRMAQKYGGPQMGESHKGAGGGKSGPSLRATPSDDRIKRPLRYDHCGTCGTSLRAGGDAPSLPEAPCSSTPRPSTAGTTSRTRAGSEHELLEGTQSNFISVTKLLEKGELL